MKITDAHLLDGSQFGRTFVRLVQGAKERIVLRQFLIDIRPQSDREGTVRRALHALAEAAWRGVRVEVLLPEIVGVSEEGGADYDLNWPAVRFLEARGLPVHRYRGSRQRPFAHAKLLLVDGEHVLCGNANLSPYALGLNFEQVVAARSRELHEALDARCKTALRHAAPSDVPAPSHADALDGVPGSEPLHTGSTGARTAPYWPPERPSGPLPDELVSLERSDGEAEPVVGQAYVRAVAKLIDGAKSRVWLAMMGLRASSTTRTQALTRSVAAARARGVDVRVLFESRDDADRDWGADAKELRLSKVDARAWRAPVECTPEPSSRTRPSCSGRSVGRRGASF